MKQSHRLNVVFAHSRDSAVLKLFEIPCLEPAHETAYRILGSGRLGWSSQLLQFSRQYLKCSRLSVCTADPAAILIFDAESSLAEQKACVLSCKEDLLLTGIFRFPQRHQICGPLIERYPSLYTTPRTSLSGQREVLVIRHRFSMARATTLTFVLTALVTIIGMVFGAIEHKVSQGLDVLASIIPVVAVIQTALVLTNIGRR